MFADLVEVSCGSCREIILVVGFPTLADTRAAAADGDERAAAALPEMLGRIASQQAKSRQLLRDPSVLPDLAGPIDVEWDDEEVEGEGWVVLRVENRELWREPERWEGYQRFVEVAGLLRERYGTHLRDLRPSAASCLWLYGDNSAARGEVAEARRAIAAAHRAADREGDATTGRPTD